MMTACFTGMNRGRKRPLRRPASWIFMVAIFMFCCLPLAGQVEAWSAEAVPPTIEEILQRAQKRYGSSAFDADFTQESFMEAMDIVDKAQGHVYFKAPFKMRWHYKEPDEYLIVTDGKTVWIYRPLDKQVMVGQAADYFGDTNFTEFFTDPAKLHHRFTIEKAAFNQDSADSHVLRLVPKTSAMNVKEVFLFISKTTYDITRSDTYSAFGDKTRLQFSDFNVDQGADESLFHFDIPEGTDVLQLDQP